MAPAWRVPQQIDLVSTDVVRAWERYFRDRFPGLHIATFSCYPADVFAFNDLSDEASVKKRTNAHRRRYHRSVGVRDVLNACRQVHLVKNNVVVDWASLIERFSHEDATEGDAADGDDVGADDRDDDEDDDNGHHPEQLTAGTDDGSEAAASQPFQVAQPHPDLVTIGLVGTHAWVDFFACGGVHPRP